VFERAKTFRRQSGSEAEGASAPGGEAERRIAGEELTRAQARARARCEPLTPAEFKERRRAAEQGLLSLSSVLDKNSRARNR
jgi:hypothetical protein